MVVKKLRRMLTRMAKIVLDDSDDFVHRWCSERLGPENGGFVDIGCGDNTQLRSVLRYKHVPFASTLVAGRESESRRSTPPIDGDNPSKVESGREGKSKESAK